ncbi:siderophore-interacting protein [Dietzia cinnamea]|uniref:siderophore-interacting protein n=1 Tax=Dietzia cinnamea TaxID=321318 RepID=UPI00223AD265|nr:siderophore-interacting protein [Dietzia cinnamea]MCT2140216.1 siderophore-interacting protein [Dietzia cinnamea]MCT2265230.1 siderophore-interacting protein [Dietzia cinnamea]
MVDQTGMSEKPARRPSDRETPRPRNPHRAESWQPTALRRVRVRAVEPLAPELVRVTLEGDELGEIATDAGDAVPAVRSPSFDDVVVFCLPDPVTGEVTLPVPAPGGGLGHPPGSAALVREYTVRSLRDGALAVDLVRHASGAGVRWLESVRPGDALTIVGPRVSRALPAVDRMLAVGDATALPALARLIEERPPTLALDVLAAVPDPSALPRTVLPAVSPADADRVRVRVVAAAPGSADELINAMAAVELPAGFAWVAGESGMVTAVRRHLLARGQEPDRVQFTGYWRLGGPL